MMGACMILYDFTHDEFVQFDCTVHFDCKMQFGCKIHLFGYKIHFNCKMHFDRATPLRRALRRAGACFARVLIVFYILVVITF